MCTAPSAVQENAEMTRIKTHSTQREDSTASYELDFPAFDCLRIPHPPPEAFCQSENAALC